MCIFKILTKVVEMKFPNILHGLLATSFVFSGVASAEINKEGGYALGDKTKVSYNELSSNSEIKEGLAFIKSDDKKTLDQQIEMTEIPAIPYHEEKKAEYFKEKLQEYGLKNVHIDKTGNVIGMRRGSGDGPNLVISAHLDIAFEEGVDTTVTKKDGKLYAPGISDDNRGLAAILSVARGLKEVNTQTVGDILFVATVGEENTFRGVKALFKERDDIDGFITVDSANTKLVAHGGTAGYTINFKFHGPGGHAWGNYERPSAIHAMGRAIAEVSEWGKEDPKTTFNVGIVKGGTAENAKAVNASMLMEFRTDGGNEDDLKEKLLQAIDNSVEQENNHWEGDAQGVTVDHKIKVKIPGGRLSKNNLMVQAATASTYAVGEKPEFIDSGMTDANYSFGAGVPGIHLGGGGDADNAHSLDEWYDPTDAYLGPQKIFLTVLGLVGVKGVSEPLLTVNDNGDAETGGKDSKPKAEPTHDD